MKREINDLKKELTGLIYNFNNKNNRYCNSEFFKSIGLVSVDLKTIACAVGGNILDSLTEIFSKSKLDNVKKELDKKKKNEKFNIYLQRIIAEKGFSNSEIRERANIDKSYFYQIIRGEKVPSRDRIIQIAIALNLNVKETNKLLAMQGYILYGENPRDFIILFCIENRLGLMDVNNILYENEEKPLISVN